MGNGDGTQTPSPFFASAGGPMRRTDLDDREREAWAEWLVRTERNEPTGWWQLLRSKAGEMRGRVFVWVMGHYPRKH